MQTYWLWFPHKSDFMLRAIDEPPVLKATWPSVRGIDSDADTVEVAQGLVDSLKSMIQHYPPPEHVDKHAITLFKLSASVRFFKKHTKLLDLRVPM
jgi:hypothetical protein